MEAGELVPSGYRRIFGWKTPEVRDERVRQAFSMSYDRDLWIDTVYDTSTLEAAGLPVEVRCEAARRYVETYERVTGQRFVPDTEPPLPRIRRNLGLGEA